MKSFIPYSLLLATAACGVAYGVTSTAFTVPVGYTTLTVPANTDTNITLPLQTTATWAGISTGISTNTISVAANSYAASQFGASTSYVQVSSGALIGRQFPILSNGTGAVTVDPVGASSLAAQGFVTGNTFVIRPFWTLSTLFPGGAGIGVNSDPFSPATLLLVNRNTSSGINRAASNLYFYYDGSAGGSAGWYDNDTLTTVDNLVIDSTVSLIVRNSTASALTILNQGTVPSFSAATLVIADTVGNDTFTQLPFPVDTSLSQSRLFESGAVADSSDPFSPTDYVFTYNLLGTGFNPAASGVYFHYDGSIGGAPGWYDANTLTIVDTDLLLKAGSSIIIRKPAAGSLSAFTWTAPLPYTL